MARRIPGLEASPTSCWSAASADEACSRAACMIWPYGCSWRTLSPHHRSAASAAHALDLFRWHCVQAFGVPIETDRSGRGTRKLWSWRACTTM